MMDDMDEAQEEAMLDGCAMECINAMEMKDKGAFRAALEALVTDIIYKLTDEGESE